MDNLIKQITDLEIKACVYSETLGPNSPEVKAIDKKIAELNTIILDLMVETQ